MNKATAERNFPGTSLLLRTDECQVKGLYLSQTVILEAPIEMLNFRNSLGRA